MFSMELDGIRIGCSGYSYPEWIGPFYPADTPRDALLARYAAAFDLLEVHHTRYRVPTAAAMERLVRGTGGGVQLTVRAPRPLLAAGGRDEALARALREALAPLRGAGVLRAVLAEFPAGFPPVREAARHVLWLQRAVRPHPLAVEFRGGGWARPRVYDWLRRRGIALCSVDQPRLPGLFPGVPLHTGPLAYVRFHGRNTARWGPAEDPGDRHAYRYGDRELVPWVPHLRSFARAGVPVLVVFHNHRDGGAPRDACRLRELLLGRVPEARK